MIPFSRLSRPFLLMLLFLPGLLIASENRQLPPPQIASADDSGYGDKDVCYDEYDDDDELPINDIEIMYNNGRMAFLFGQFEVAYKAWGPLAEAGYAKAQASLGWMYHTGNGVGKDMKQAVNWYRFAADQGHVIAQNNLGVIFEDGLAGTIDLKKAFAWYKKSAEAGYSYAKFNLGRMYAEGLGTKKNIQEAKYWLQSAALSNVKEADKVLAQLEVKPLTPTNNKKSKPKVAHAPYHSNPVAKGLSWVKSQAVNHYTIQLTKSQDMEWILKLAASERLSQPVIQFQSKDKHGENWIYLIYGSFTSFQEAEYARKNLPESLKKWSPKLHRFGEIHQMLKK